MFEGDCGATRMPNVRPGLPSPGMLTGTGLCLGKNVFHLPALALEDLDLKTWTELQNHLRMNGSGSLAVRREAAEPYGFRSHESRRYGRAE